MRLVDHEHPHPADQIGQLLLAEGGIVEPLRRHQEHIDLVALKLCEHVGPLVDVAGVDSDRADPGPRGCRDLVAHEGEQRRNQDGGPGTLTAKQQRRDEVHGGLAPAGALHHEGPAPPLDEGFDGLVLSVVEVGGIRTDKRAQDLEGGRAGLGYGLGYGLSHPPSLAGAPDMALSTPPICPLVIQRRAGLLSMRMPQLPHR